MLGHNFVSHLLMLYTLVAPHFNIPRVCCPQALHHRASDLFFTILKTMSGMLVALCSY